MNNTNWFTEADLPYGQDGIRLQVKVTDVLYDHTTEWGSIKILDTPFYGKLMTIDDIIQVTESEEFIYHEMMTILPGLEHGAPKRILIIGGGDGGALKQALRFSSVTQATQVEIDDTVTKICREYLPTVSGGAFDDPRARLIYADGAKFLTETDETFDVILLDLTDPVPDGPAEPLFEQAFMQTVAQRLTPNGVVVMQCGSLVLQPAEVRNQVARMKAVFQSVRLHNAVVPSYQLTSFGFVLASNGTDLDTPLSSEAFTERMRAIAGDNKYLSPEMYLASQALPPYIADTVYA